MAKQQIYILYIKNEQKQNVEITHTVEHLLTVCVQEAVIPEHPSSTETGEVSQIHSPALPL